MKPVGRGRFITVDNHKILFVLTFTVVPFTKYVKKRSTIISLLKQLTLKKVDKFDMASAVTDIESHPFNPVIIHVHNSEETRGIKKLVKLANELDDKGAIILQECDFDGVYKPPNLPEGSITIR